MSAVVNAMLHLGEEELDQSSLMHAMKCSPPSVFIHRTEAAWLRKIARSASTSLQPLRGF